MKDRKAKKAISRVAKNHNVSKAAVRNDMKAAIAEAMKNPDPKMQAIWKQIPCAGEAPEPEELIAWIMTQIPH